MQKTLLALRASIGALRSRACACTAAPEFAYSAQRVRMVRRLVGQRMWYGRFNPYGPYNRFARAIWHKPIFRVGPRSGVSREAADRTTFPGAALAPTIETTGEC